MGLGSSRRGGTRAASALAGALSCVALLVGAAPAAATVWRGTSLDAFGYGPETAQRQLDLNQQAGANAVRIDVSWSKLEPTTKGQYDPGYVAQVDDYVDQASARGLKVIAVLLGTPCWASSAPPDLRQNCSGDWRSRDVTVYPPAANSDYADASAYVARRWGSKLAAIEVWNEPNVTERWRTPNPVADYAHLLEAAYPAIKSAAPEVPVVGGALVWSDRGFLDSLYANGIHGFFDALSIHPYSPPSGESHGPKYSFAQGVPWVRDDMV